MQKVKVVSDGIGFGSKVLMPDGTEIPGVYKVAVKPFTCEDAVVVILEVYAELEIEGQPILGMTTLVESADALGFKLVPKDAPETLTVELTDGTSVEVPVDVR